MKLNIVFAFYFFSLIVFTSCDDHKPEDKEYKIKDSASGENIHLDPKNYFKDCKRLFNYAQSVDSILYTQEELNKELGNKAIKAFTDYAYYCGNDSLSPIFLIKAGQVAQAINNAPQAKIVLEKCIQDYPNFNGITAAMFLLAQLYDNEVYLNNEEEARRLYQEILTKYPNCPEAESAKGALRFIGKTDKEMMEEIKREEAKKQNVKISIQ